MRFLRHVTTAMAMSVLCAATAPAVLAAPEFLNGLALDGVLLDRAHGRTAR